LQASQPREATSTDMETIKILVSLVTDASDFQREQAKTAQDAAKSLRVDARIIYARDDSIVQSEQLLAVIQGEARERPDAIIVQPCGRTGLPQVARAAAQAGIAWVVLNAEVNYLSHLRATHRVSAFSVNSNQQEIGRIQGRQMAAMLPQGGSVLYIQGPSNSIAAPERTAGMNQTKPQNILLRTLKSDTWGEEGGLRAVSTYLRLSTAQQDRIAMIMGQSDLLTLGARHKLMEQTNRLDVPLTGVDGLPDGGQKWVQKGWLTATIVVPPNAGTALEFLVKAISTGIHPAEVTYTVPASYPSLEELQRNTRQLESGPSTKKS
jgi:ribose transport system substrate-binding protein